MLFSKENLHIFVRALGSESLKTILRNGYRKIRSYRYTNHFVDSGCIYHIDAIARQSNRLYLKGWCHSIHENTSIVLEIDNTNSFPIALNIPRPDVKQRLNLSIEEEAIGFIAIHECFKTTSNLSTIIHADQREIIFDLSFLIPIKPFLDLPFRQQYLFYHHDQNNYIAKKFISKGNIPLISIITPTYNTPAKYLNICIQSVINQIYENWELILYDDASTSSETKECLKEWEEKKDPRIKIYFGSKNQHISLANNSAISQACGAFIGFLDHDDEISPDALIEVVTAVNKNPALDLLYSDEDKIDLYGIHSGPYFKPDFSIDHIRSNNFMCHFLVIRKSLGDSFGWFQPGLEGAQDYDCILKAIDRTNPEKIHHIPRVLYHWRMIEGSTALKFDEKSYALEAGKKAIEAHLSRNRIVGKVTYGPWKGAYRVEYDHLQSKISILIPFKDQIRFLKNCIKSILKNTEYTNYEILLLDNQSKEQRTSRYVSRVTRKYSHIRTINFNEPFNFSKINNFGAIHAEGEYLLLLNNDTKVISKGWLKSMAELIHRPEIGAVGAKLLYKDNTIQHAGVVTGIGGSAGHIFKGQPNGHHYFTMGLIRNVGAVTGACLMVKKSIYNQVGGLDEVNLKIAYNDIDLCLKIRKAGYLIAYTPYAELYHYESKSRGYEDTPAKKARHDREKDYLQMKWGDFLMKDPYFNPNFSLQTEKLSINIDVHE